MERILLREYTDVKLIFAGFRRI